MLTWGVSARFPVSCNILIRIENIVFISKEKSYDLIVKVFQENPECIISKGGGSRSRVRTVKSCGEWERHLKKKKTYPLSLQYQVLQLRTTQPSFTCLKSTMETPD